MVARKDYNFDRRANKYDDGFEGSGSERFYRNLLSQIGDKYLQILAFGKIKL